jgi:hypothetical protein
MIMGIMTLGINTLRITISNIMTISIAADSIMQCNLITQSILGKLQYSNISITLTQSVVMLNVVMQKVRAPKKNDK